MIRIEGRLGTKKVTSFFKEFQKPSFSWVCENFGEGIVHIKLGSLFYPFSNFDSFLVALCCFFHAAQQVLMLGRNRTIV